MCENSPSPSPTPLDSSASLPSPYASGSDKDWWNSIAWETIADSLLGQFDLSLRLLMAWEGSPEDEKIWSLRHVRLWSL